jgi:hypothetical protein
VERRALGRVLGSMSGRGLNRGQREGVAIALGLGIGDVGAVVGLPGTGKTSLIGAIVASAMVRAAVEGGEAPLVLCCSTNNQALAAVRAAVGRGVEVVVICDDTFVRERLGGDQAVTAI